MEIVLQSPFFWSILFFVVLVAFLLVFSLVFRRLFSQTYWCLTVRTDRVSPYFVVSSGRYLLKPPDSFDAYGGVCRVWFITEYGAMNAAEKLPFEGGTQLCHSLANGS